jgi:hypothetical protein
MNLADWSLWLVDLSSWGLWQAGFSKWGLQVGIVGAVSSD